MKHLDRYLVAAGFLVLVRPSSSLFRAKDVFSCFVLHSNEFLEKSGNVLIENVNDVNECLRKCTQAPISYQLTCRTVMYNVNSGNCVLSKYSREERKVKKSKGLQIDLYENKCGNENEKIRLAIFNEQIRTTSAPLIIRIFSPKPILSTTVAPVTNELRRAHAVKQYQLERRKENAQIYSKTIYAESLKDPQTQIPNNPSTQSRPVQKIKNSSGRPLVDSTSFLNLPQATHVKSQFQLQADVIQARKQRSDIPIENFAPCFIKTANHVLPKYEEVKITGLTFENCMRQCATTTNFYCASINYNFGAKICILNGGNVYMNGDLLIVSRDYDYFENRCQPKTATPPSVPANIVPLTKKECYRFYNNTVYNSFDATIVPGMIELENCEAECSWSQIKRHKNCVGMNWVASNNGCMLFHKPIDFNILQPSFKSVFLANTCSNSTTHDPSKHDSKTKGSGGQDYYDT